MNKTIESNQTSNGHRVSGRLQRWVIELSALTAKLAQMARCHFKGHSFYNTGETRYVENWDELFSGYYVEVRRCKCCGNERPGAVVAEELWDEDQEHWNCT